MTRVTTKLGFHRSRRREARATYEGLEEVHHGEGLHADGMNHQRERRERHGGEGKPRHVRSGERRLGLTSAWFFVRGEESLCLEG